MKTQVFFIYVTTINILSFLLYAIDKRKAKRKMRRIPEWQLISIALLGGSLGAWSAMYLFRHKTKHGLFIIGIPIIIGIQIISSIYFIY